MPVITVKPDDPALQKGITAHADELTASPPAAKAPLGNLDYHPSGTDATPAGSFGDKYIRPIANTERAFIRTPADLIKSLVSGIYNLPANTMQSARDFAHPVQALRRDMGIKFVPNGSPLPANTDSSNVAPKVNYDQAIPDLVGRTAAQSLLARFLLGEPISDEKAVNKLSFASGKGTSDAIRATLPELRGTVKILSARTQSLATQPRSLLSPLPSTKQSPIRYETPFIRRWINSPESQPATPPETVSAFLDLTKNAKSAISRESANALGPIANVQTFPVGIQQKILSLITPNMAKTAEGRADIAAIKNAAIEYSQPWTYGELDAERLKLNSELSNFERKNPVARYTAAKSSIPIAIDKAIADSIRDTVYPKMDQLAGKPTGYFRALKQKQGNLIQLESSLNDETKRLRDTTARIKGAPRFSRDNASIYIGAEGTPRGHISGILNAIKKPNPEAVANRRVRQAFHVPNPAPAAIPFMIPRPEDNQ